MRRTTEKPRWLIRCVMLALCVPVSGCYYLQAAAGQWQVMQKREPISEVIDNEDTPQALSGRLRLVQAARQFSVEELLLPDNDSYRSYADIEREFVVWNVFAAPEFSLQAKQWCFPVAGCVAYRGYFSRDAAEKAARRLQEDGFDVFVGGVSAYSTLGNFSDPVLSSMLRWDDIRLVGVLFHELAHQVLYVKGDTGFNEAFATAVEEHGIERWLRSRGKHDDIATYQERRALRRDMMALVAAARSDLGRNFASKVDEAGKRRLKRARLQQLGLDVTARLLRSGRKADGWHGDELNNARLASMMLYEARLPAFRALLANCDNNMRCFYDQATVLSRKDRAARNAALDELAGSQSGVVVGSLDEP